MPVFLTILTSSLNNRETVFKTISSIKKQNFNTIEHIVIDGGSQDGTLNVLKANECDYNLKFISEPDDGIADALNKGLKLSKGKSGRS